MAKTSAIVFGIIFLIAGIWGFFAQPVLWIFAADVVSSIIHVVVGIVLLVLASKPGAAMTLKTIGIVYVIFAIIGFIQGSTVLSIFVTNGAANWLYLVLGIVAAVIGFSAKGSAPAVPAQQA